MLECGSYALIGTVQLVGIHTSAPFAHVYEQFNLNMCVCVCVCVCVYFSN